MHKNMTKVQLKLKALSYCVLAGFKTNTTDTFSNRSLNRVDGRVSCISYWVSIHVRRVVFYTCEMKVIAKELTPFCE